MMGGLEGNDWDESKVGWGGVVSWTGDGSLAAV